MGRIENKRVGTVIQLLVDKSKPLSAECCKKLVMDFGDVAIREFCCSCDGFELDTHGFAEWYALKLAKSTATAPRMLKELVLRINNPKLWLEVIENPNCEAGTLELLLMLKSDCAQQIRLAIAKNPKADNTVLKKLVTLGGANTCRLVMNHPNVKTETLWFMVDTLPVKELKEFATDPMTPELMLHIMAWKQGGVLAHDVANNPATPERTLHRLLHSKNPLVRSAAKHNLEERKLY